MVATTPEKTLHQKFLNQYFDAKFDKESELKVRTEQISRDPLSDPFSWARIKVRPALQGIWKPSVFSGWRHALRFATDIKYHHEYEHYVET